MGSLKKHVVVVGMGMAGLMAACGARAKGHRVTLLGTGAGALSIGGACVDVLGYMRHNDGVRAVRNNPVEASAHLPTSHPYRLLGKEAVHEGLEALQEIVHGQGLTLHCGAQAAETYDAHAHNVLVPTMMGTLKPTYLCSASHHAHNLLGASRSPDEASRIAVITVDAIRDCHPALVVQGLQQYALFKQAHFTTASIPWPKGKAHRPLSPLDVARFVDTEAGRTWLVAELLLLAHDVDAILIPPILGVRESAWHSVQERLQRPVVEMVTMPPGVGGLRVFTALMRSLRQGGHESDVHVVENATVTHAEMEGEGTQGRRCTALLAKGEGPVRRYVADAFIVATGGILGGGIVTEPGKAHERIFRLPIDAPADPQEWSADGIFGTHPFASMGLSVNERFVPVDAQGRELLSNVHFAGRILGAYDYVTEKSGNGVAATTGWHVGQNCIGGASCSIST